MLAVDSYLVELFAKSKKKNKEIMYVGNHFFIDEGSIMSRNIKTHKDQF